MNFNKGMFFDAEGKPGEPQAAEPQKPESNEPMLPKSRFDEVNEKRIAAEAELAKLKQERQAEIDKQLEEQGKWKDIADKRAQKLLDAENKAKEVDSLQATLKKMLEKELESLPDESKKLIPTKLSVSDQLDYITTNRAILSKPSAPDINAGNRGAGDPEEGTELTAEEIAYCKKFGVKPEDYKKYK